MGDVEHGVRIINELHRICTGFNFDFAIKFQYRDLDTFIHPLYKNDFSYKYIKRFSETRLTWEQLKILKDEAKRLAFLTECTPFDTASVNKVEEYDFDFIKIASCSFTDWPLLEQIVKVDKPIIASTAGASLISIDQVVNFFIHRNRNLALMHCVAEYPTPDSHLQLNQIDLLKERYPYIPIGFSTHEHPDNMQAVQLAVAKGVTLLERHVGIETDSYKLNKYSSIPQNIKYWLLSIEKAMEMCGKSGERTNFTEQEQCELRALGRGVFAKHDITPKQKIEMNDIMLAIPTQNGQLIANDLSKYTELYALLEIKKDKPIMLQDVSIINNQKKVYEILKHTQNLIKESGIVLPTKLDMEISHHYGIDKFYEYGCILINVINKSYCKKLIIVFQGQTHPEQYHKIKEETFHLLFGDLTVKLNGEELQCKPGDIVDISPGVKHSFSSKKGAIIEEISSTHIKSDSYYTDPEIAKNKYRKMEITYWI